ncbi:NACHT domain-containing protein, partial [Calothrix rhizosoleniae]|uniref:NACHT domain-containing protein n=1 Tax=Calothrix rhizosoleniae TaxID=888997 RepID=UPI001F31ED13
ELAQFTLGIITNLLSSVIYDSVNHSKLQYFQRWKIEKRVEYTVEYATMEIVEPLLQFLTNEKVSEDKQRRLIETCVEELRPLTEQPEQLFQGSLNGQKIFEDLYTNRDLPEVVIEDGLKDVYTLLCPRIATLLCKIPAAVKDWESEAWSENFRRFDEITTQLRTLFNKVDELAALPSKEADGTLTIVRRTLAQKLGLELDITGLRADRPLHGKFDDFFVHPQITEQIKSNANKKQAKVIGETQESFELFTQKHHWAIIIGQPGAGKSTWAKWLQREALSNRWTGICVRFELRRFSNEEHLLSLHELIREPAGQHLAEDLTPNRISEWLKAKQVVFILDGFDEIRPSRRDQVYDWIVDLSSAVRNCPFILTSRPLTTDHLERLSSRWQSWTIEPFDEPRIIDYIQRWYKYTRLLLENNHHEVDAKALAEKWQQDPTISPLTSNPLLLSTLLMVHHLDGSLPSGRSQLYQRYVEGMLGLWDTRRNVSATTIQLSREQKRQIIRGFALQMFLQEQDQIDESEALELVRGLLQKINVSFSAEDVLALFRERSGLIIGPGIYSFVHKSVAEYLVADSILQGDQRDKSGRRIDRFCLFENRDDDRWNTVIFLWAGLAPTADVEEFLDECIKANKWDLAYGILADQYDNDRFSVEMRRRFFLKIINADQQLVPYHKNISWGYSHPQRKDKIRLPIITFDLRGIVFSNPLGFYSILERAVNDGILTWSDSTNAKGKIRDILWMCCISKVTSIDEWKTCLMAPCPEDDKSIDWLYWVAEFVFYNRLMLEAGVSRTKHQIKSVIELETLIQVYKDACPHICGLVPIVLMSITLKLINPIFPTKQKLNYESLDKILKLLPNSNDGKILTEWLAGTREWVNPAIDNNTDLLNAFTEKMAELVQQSLIKQDAVYENAINFVEELRKQREALE